MGKEDHGETVVLRYLVSSETALAKYLAGVDEIQAGRDPGKTGVVRVSLNELTMAKSGNLFPERQHARVTSGEITSCHFSGCLNMVCGEIQPVAAPPWKWSGRSWPTVKINVD